MRVTVCGARGSTPAPGPDHVRYGGHTSCVAVAHDGAAPSLVLDAGTGIRRLTPLLGGAPFAGAILFGHLHWDHTQGLPFFAGADRPGADTDVYLPAQGDPEEVLRRAMSPPHFPITPDQLRGAWRFHALEPGDHRIAGFEVQAREIPHKGGRTFGYRVSDGRGSLAYLSDHCPTALGPGPDGLGEYHPAALELARRCDVLLHDAQYLDEELAARAAFGHASVGYAVRLAARACAARLLLFHHDPPRTDDELDSVVASLPPGPVPVGAAVEGMVLDLPAP
ncbi:MAG TPA: MBL fold metallo-hydrolase [Acidimicrobiales bacterium]|nr:MBL fold metallo-hydrolase [Acidimicrobiales bacterium]